MTGSEPRPVDTIAVIGMAYSGSTMLATLLGQHPDIVSLGEVTGPGHLGRPLDTFPCGCGDPVADCDLWSAIAAEMRSAGHDFSVYQWHLRLDALDTEGAARTRPRRALRQLIDRSLRATPIDSARDRVISTVPPFAGHVRDRVARNQAFLDAARQVTATTTLADTSKDAVRVERLRRWTQQRILVVHLVRDSLGATASWLRHQKPNGPANVAPALRSWTRSLAAAERVERGAAAAEFVRTRYEDLCADPVAEVDRLFAAAGLPPHEVEPVIGRGPHILGNRIRLDDPRPIRLDERWRDQLNRRQLDEIIRRTGSRRERLGYAPV